MDKKIIMLNQIITDIEIAREDLRLGMTESAEQNINQSIRKLVDYRDQEELLENNN
jgi:hypothetical protein